MAKNVIKVENNNKEYLRRKQNEKSEVDIRSQERLAEILNDSPRKASLAGTEWEIRTLRQKVQWMIAEEVIKINKQESATYGDIIKQFAVSMPAVCKVITLALLNNKDKIFENGIEENGFSELYQATYDTVAWEGNASEYANLLLEILEMLDISFFLESHRMLEMFRVATMTRKKTTEQK